MIQSAKNNIKKYTHLPFPISLRKTIILIEKFPFNLKVIDPISVAMLSQKIIK